MATPRRQRKPQIRPPSRGLLAVIEAIEDSQPVTAGERLLLERKIIAIMRDDMSFLLESTCRDRPSPKITTSTPPAPTLFDHLKPRKRKGAADVRTSQTVEARTGSAD